MSDKRVEKILADLNKATGLSLTLTEIPEGGEEEMAEKLRMLSSAWKNQYDRADFLRNLFYGNVSPADVSSYASRFRMPEEGLRRLYVVELSPEDAGNAVRVLKAMLARKSGDITELSDERHLVLIRMCDPSKEEDPQVFAHTIVDMLGAEIMTAARVGFASPAGGLPDLPEAFRNALTALEIGRMFYMNESVFDYDNLGVGHLIHDLPEETCRSFLREVYGEEGTHEFDEEQEALISAFFDNNLNISEAARQLYLHRNTLVYRLEKLRQATGLDLRIFGDAVKLRLAMMIDARLRG